MLCQILRVATLQVNWLLDRQEVLQGNNPTLTTGIWYLQMLVKAVQITSTGTREDKFSNVQVLEPEQDRIYLREAKNVWVIHLSLSIAPLKNLNWVKRYSQLKWPLLFAQPQDGRWIVEWSPSYSSLKHKWSLSVYLMYASVHA